MRCRALQLLLLFAMLGCGESSIIPSIQPANYFSNFLDTDFTLEELNLNQYPGEYFAVLKRTWLTDIIVRLAPPVAEVRGCITLAAGYEISSNNEVFFSAFIRMKGICEGALEHQVASALMAARRLKVARDVFELQDGSGVRLLELRRYSGKQVDLTGKGSLFNSSPDGFVEKVQFSSTKLTVFSCVTYTFEYEAYSDHAVTFRPLAHPNDEKCPAAQRRIPGRMARITRFDMQSGRISLNTTANFMEFYLDMQKKVR